MQEVRHALSEARISDMQSPTDYTQHGVWPLRLPGKNEAQLFKERKQPLIDQAMEVMGVWSSPALSLQ